jgi:hypothetical protein
MKTKAFLVLFLFSGTLLTQLAAQPLPDPYAHNKHGTGATVYFGGPVQINDWGIPVFCDDQFTFMLLLTGTVTWVDHWQNGNWLSLTAVFHGECKNPETGEVFRFNEKVSNTGVTLPNPWVLTWKVNLIGDQGHHYIMSFTYVVGDEYSTTNHAICL